MLAEFSTWTPSPRPCPSPSSALSAALTSLQHGNGTKQPKVNGESNMCETSDWCVSVQDVHILSVSDLQLTKKVKINNFNSGLRGSAYLNTQSWDYFCKCWTALTATIWYPVNINHVRLGQCCHISDFSSIKTLSQRRFLKIALECIVKSFICEFSWSPAEPLVILIRRNGG